MLIVPRKRAVFLDVDGVIFRHKRLQQKVGQRCGLFVAQQLGVNYEIGLGVNRLMYERYGHTLYGFEHGIRDLEKEFTEFVYNSRVMEDLMAAGKDTEVVRDRESVLRLLNRCARKGVDTWIMSNAPQIWCDGVVESMQLGIDREKILYCGHDWYGGDLKPEQVVYMRVGMRMKDKECILIDDSVRNIQGAELAGWKGRLFGPSDQLGDLLF